MSDFIPKPTAPRTTGLGPKAQKLQALREKAAQLKTGAQPSGDNTNASLKAKSSFSGKKTAFQRKAT